MSHPIYGSSPAYAVGTLYQDIQVGHKYFGPDGLEIEVIGLQVTSCGERRLMYAHLPRKPEHLETQYSVPFGLLGNYIYFSKPSAEQIAANAEEKKRNEGPESSDDDT